MCSVLFDVRDLTRDGIVLFTSSLNCKVLEENEPCQIGLLKQSELLNYQV